jgi:hypothetical protein
MTVDSFYFPEVYELDDDVEYFFEMESIGAEAIKVYLVLDTGERILLVQDNA